MRNKLLQIRVDDEFLSKLEYLKEINDFKSNSETVRKIFEKEYRKEKGSAVKGEKRAYWEQLKRNSYRCSNCHYRFNIVNKNIWARCPICEAKMSGRLKQKRSAEYSTKE